MSGENGCSGESEGIMNHPPPAGRPAYASPRSTLPSSARIGKPAIRAPSAMRLKLGPCSTGTRWRLQEKSVKPFRYLSLYRGLPRNESLGRRSSFQPFWVRFEGAGRRRSPYVPALFQPFEGGVALPTGARAVGTRWATRALAGGKCWSDEVAAASTS